MDQKINSPLKEKTFVVLRNPIFWAFAASFLYWIYLFFTSTMVIAHDSIGYQSLGRLIHESGWIGFFQNGPNREPLYPFIISLSMGLGKLFSVPYQPFLKIIQLSLLFLTQILSLKILQNLNVRKNLASLCIFYLGFSPALINAALSIYSEIATLPLVLGIVLSATYLWRSFETGRTFEIIFKSILFTTLFITLTLVKGIYEFIFNIFLIPFLILFTHALFLKRKTRFINLLISLVIIILTFSISIHAYKHLNETYNGHFTLTDSRGAYSIYSSAARRTENLTYKQVLAGMTYTAGQGACDRIFGKEDCYFWGISNYDSYGMSMLKETSEKYPKNQVDSVMLDLAKEKILQKPLQFTLLTVLEGVKMFFWESTQISFVEYAPWQTKLYAFGPFKDALRLLVSLLSLGGFFFTLINILKNRKKLLETSSPEGKSIQTIGFIVLIATCHIGIHSLFMTIPRFIFPIAPLYLIMAAFSFDRILPRGK